MLCLSCGKDIVGKAVMLQEDAQTTLAEEKIGNFEGWKGTPIGTNGMHYMVFHPDHFLRIYAKLFELENNVSCMLYIANIEDFEVALEDETRRRPS